jgi:hypothetical protein
MRSRGGLLRARNSVPFVSSRRSRSTAACGPPCRPGASAVACTLDALKPDHFEAYLLSRGGAEEFSARYAWRLLTLVDEVQLHRARATGLPRNSAALDLLMATPEWRFANASDKTPLPDPSARARGEGPRFLVVGSRKRLRRGRRACAHLAGHAQPHSGSAATRRRPHAPRTFVPRSRTAWCAMVPRWLACRGRSACQRTAASRRAPCPHKPPERLVLDELLVDLRVVLQQDLHHLAQRLVVAMRAVCGVFSLGVLEGLVGGHLGRDVVADALGRRGRCRSNSVPNCR